MAGVAGFLLVPQEVGVVIEGASPENGELPAPRREERALPIPGIDAILDAEGREKLLLLAKAVPTMDGADLASLLQKLIAQEDDSDIAFAAAVRTVLHHWVEFDPEAVMDFVKKNSGPRVPSLPDLLRQWQAIRPDPAGWCRCAGRQGQGPQSKTEFTLQHDDTSYVIARLLAILPPHFKRGSARLRRHDDCLSCVA